MIIDSPTIYIIRYAYNQIPRASTLLGSDINDTSWICEIPVRLEQSACKRLQYVWYPATHHNRLGELKPALASAWAITNHRSCEHVHGDFCISAYRKSVAKVQRNIETTKFCHTDLFGGTQMQVFMAHRSHGSHRFFLSRSARHPEGWRLLPKGYG